jgi:CRP-like cAMP-binding protein
MKSNYLLELVDSMNFSADIPREELRKLFRRKKIMHIKKNDYFLRAGEVPERISYNISGLLRLFYIDNSGIEINKHFCQEKTLAVSYGGPSGTLFRYLHLSSSGRETGTSINM